MKYWQIDIEPETSELEAGKAEQIYGLSLLERLEDALTHLSGTHGARSIEVSFKSNKCALAVSVDDYDPRKERQY